MRNNEMMKQKLKMAMTVLFALVEEMDQADDETMDLMIEPYIEYMPYLPSFDDFVWQFASFAEEYIERLEK